MVWPKKKKYPHVGLEQIVRDKLLLIANPSTSDTAKAARIAGARDVIVLSRSGPEQCERRPDYLSARFNRAADICKNNSDVALLNGLSSFALWKKRWFSRLTTILIPFDRSLASAAPGIVRYARGKGLTFTGTTSMPIGARSKTCLVFENRIPPQRVTRIYGPSDLGPLEILKALSGIDYVLLRWIEEIEADRHEGDLDLLVSAQSLPELKVRLSRSAGMYPVDVYTSEGGLDHQFNTVPYFFPDMASRILDSAIVRDSGIRVPSPRWRFLSYCYHLLFHKSAHISPRHTALDEKTFPSPRYARELARLAKLAYEPAPTSFDDLERLLREADAFPPMDTIGFYGLNNKFLSRRYASHQLDKPGLCVFYVRDFGDGAALVERIRAQLLKKFQIIAEDSVESASEQAIVRNVRGGNWSDKAAPNGIAKPIHWFVCWDPAPMPPSRATRNQYPRVDNENIRIKSEIRSGLSTLLGQRPGVLHSTDNTTEAKEHLLHLGLGDRPEIIALGLVRPRQDA